MPEGRELTWDDTRQGGDQALVGGEALYDGVDAEQGRSNIDVEKHLRRVELKLAQTHAWFAMARERDCCIYAEDVVGVRRSGAAPTMDAPRSSRNARSLP